MKRSVIALASVGLLCAGLATPSWAAPKLPPVTTQNGVSTQTALASDAFPGLKGVLNLPAAEKTQMAVYYTVKIKNADPSQVRVTLNDGGQSHPLTIQSDGRISPLPTREQINNGAKITISGPESGTYAMRIHVYSTQGSVKSYDAAGLTLGVKQANAAMTKIAGPLSMLLTKLDRVYFVGGGNGTVEIGGQSKALPRTTTAGEYPAGTPYFVPSTMAGATRITLSNAPSNALFDNPPK